MKIFLYDIHLTQIADSFRKNETNSKSLHFNETNLGDPTNINSHKCLRMVTFFKLRKRTFFLYTELNILFSKSKERNA